MDVTLVIKDGLIVQFDTSLKLTGVVRHPLVGHELKEGEMFLFSQLLNPGHQELEMYFAHLEDFLRVRKDRDVLERDVPPLDH